MSPFQVASRTTRDWLCWAFDDWGRQKMKKSYGKSANGYWLILAGSYGLTISMAAMTPMPWLLLVAGIFIVFPVVVGAFYGQIGRKAERKLVSDSPAIVMATTAFAVAGILLRGSSIVVWAGPILGLVTFIGMYFCLRRYGRFHPPVQENSSSDERIHTR